MKRTSTLTAFSLFLTFSVVSTLPQADSTQDPNRELAVRRDDGRGGEARIALVIGNSAYQDAPLLNPANDARGAATESR